MDEARRRASEALVPDAKSLHALERLHEPLYKRFTALITPDRLRVGERWALAVTASVLLAGGLALLRINLLDQPVLWPGLALGAVFVSATAAMQELNSSGSTRQTIAQFGPPGEGETVNDILGVPEVYELERRYEASAEEEQAR